MKSKERGREYFLYIAITCLAQSGLFIVLLLMSVIFAETLRVGLNLASMNKQ